MNAKFCGEDQSIDGLQKQLLMQANINHSKSNETAIKLINYNNYQTVLHRMELNYLNMLEAIKMQANWNRNGSPGLSFLP